MILTIDLQKLKHILFFSKYKKTCNVDNMYNHYVLYLCMFVIVSVMLLNLVKYVIFDAQGGSNLKKKNKIYL